MALGTGPPNSTGAFAFLSAPSVSANAIELPSERPRDTTAAMAADAPTNVCLFMFLLALQQKSRTQHHALPKKSGPKYRDTMCCSEEYVILAGLSPGNTCVELLHSI